MAENNATWVGKTAVETKVTALQGKVTDIEEIDDQITNGTGGTEQKRLAKENAAVKALRIAKPMAVFAKDTYNLELFGEIDFEWVDLRYGKDQDGIDRWQLVHDRGFANDAALVAGGYIEAGWVAELDTAIGMFEAQRGKPKAKRSNVKALNKQLNQNVKELVAIKNDLLDVLVQFKDSQPDFYDAVTAAFEPDMTGVRHLALRVRYTDKATGVKLLGVQGTIVELGLTKTSGHKGVIEFSRQELAQGNYTLQSVLNLYTTSEMINIGLSNEELVTLEVELERSNSVGTTGIVKGNVRYQGTAVPNATISAQGQSTTTNEQGQYMLTDVAVGDVTVKAILPPSIPASPQSKQATVVAGQTTTCDFEF